MRQKPRSVSEDRGRHRMNARVKKENIRGFGELNTVRNAGVSEDSGNSSLGTSDSHCRES